MIQINAVVSAPAKEHTMMDTLTIVIPIILGVTILGKDNHFEYCPFYLY
jgi:hypothetical protein